MTFEIRDLPINAVRVKEPHRSIDEKKLATIKDSMEKIGLKTPITVRARDKGPVLVAGLHRLNAAKALGWKGINCMIIDCKKVDADLWRLAENLHRAELNALQRSEFVKDWQRLLKERAKGAQVARPGGRQPNDKGNSATAKALGTSRDDVRRAKAIASISPKAKAAAKAAGLQNNKSALLKIAKKKSEKAQIKKVHEIANRKKEGGDRLSWSDRRLLLKLTRLFEAARELKQTWASAKTAVRSQFISQVLKPLGSHHKS